MNQNIIYCLLPVYNEGESIYELLRQYSIFFDRTVYKHKIIVVNDFSSDNSEDFILNAKKDFENLDINYIKHDSNMGLGGALTTGFNDIFSYGIKEQDFIVTMDGDNTHNPHIIKNMIDKAFEGADIVIASRYLEQSRIIGLSRLRIFLSICARFIYTLTWNIYGVRDYTCGFRLYRGSVFNRFMQKYKNSIIKESGFAATAEVLKKMNAFNPLVVEVPMILKYSNKVNSSNMQIIKTIYKTLGMLFVRTK